MDRYLRGQPLQAAEAPEAAMEIVDARLPKWVESRKRIRMPTLAAKERIRSYKEVDAGYPEKDAVAEARRCLSCDVCGNCMFDRAQVCLATGSRLL